VLPHLDLAHLYHRWLLDFSFFWGIVLDLTLVGLLNIPVEALGGQRGGGTDPSDLNSKVDLLSLKVEWVCKDQATDVTTKCMLDLTSVHNIRWFKICELSPFSERRITYPINKLINSLSSRLNIFGDSFSSLLRFSSFKASFSNIIISLCTFDFPPKSEIRSSSFNDQRL
jgi:hypothetical protein